MSIPLCLLLPWLLVFQEPEPIQQGTLDLRTELGADPALRIRLAPPGCWDGLLLGPSPRLAAIHQRRLAEATVEVWDLLPPSSPRREVFGLYLGSLRERLSKAWLAPPPKHQAIELSDIMANDPSTPQKLDITKVKSMQERFNRLPPHGSSVKENRP